MKKMKISEEMIYEKNNSFHFYVMLVIERNDCDI